MKGNMKMRRAILCATAFLMLALSGCSWLLWEELDPMPVPKDESCYVNVKDHGAVGDAAYHHFFGVRKDSYTYWVGHFSRLVSTTFCEPYKGSSGSAEVPTYKIVPNTAAGSSSQIRLADVNPVSGYKPAVGDVVVQYEAADEKKSVYATDDSKAFEAALAAGDGLIYLPEGDYMISQLTAMKIQDITGPGRIWLKEWKGGTLWYLLSGTSDFATFQNYGWIDAEHFHDEIWRAMHWTTCLPEVHGWTSSEQFSGNFSPRMEYDFDDTRDTANIWLTVTPAVPKEQFPDTITICIGKDAGSRYSLHGESEWNPASYTGLGGGMYHSSWNGDNVELPSSAFKEQKDWVEITLSKKDFFPDSANNSKHWLLHCWSAKDISIGSKDVEFVSSYARVWVKDSKMDDYVMCDIGIDMRPSWDNRWNSEGKFTTEYYIHEACNGTTQLLTSTPQEFYAYTITDDRVDSFS